ncbi:hypothetical protein [Pseudonocardia sp. GCM10023141]|uniref:hypothetical protein n=1 Tax=Pseudonocardia sp. GCM10023141 TaxID=3252653 RepID=UPI0036082BBF
MIAASRTRLLVPLLVVLGVVLAGCGSPAAPSAPLPRGSISDLADKLSLIVQDECQTRPAADVYPRCGRFTAELGNVATAAQSAAAGQPKGAAVQTAATALSAALATFTQDGCLGQTPIAKCGADQAEIQKQVTALNTAVMAVPASS